MKKIIILILCICFSFVGCNSNNLNIENQSDIIWRSEDPDVYFSFNENSEYGSEGYLNINDETIPIIVIAGRKNFLYFKDARGYSENTEENYNLFYGIYKYDESSLILKIKKDYIFDYTYDKTVPNTGTVIPQTGMCNIQRFTAAAATPSAGSSPHTVMI